jgi:hypothetical protein
LAYVFVDDQFPEVEEYETNYHYFNEKEPGALKKMMQKCIKSAHAPKQRAYEILTDDFKPLSFA